MRGFNDATILSPSFHGLHKERLHNGLLLFVTTKTDKKFRGGTSRKIGRGCAARFLKPLPYFRSKSVIFDPYPISDLKPGSPEHDRSL